MEFFDQKEDVIEFVLTSHGKHLFRDGKFKPFYYAFGDTGMLYDCRHAGFSGTQNEFVNRLEDYSTLKKSVYFTNNEQENQSEFLDRNLLGSGELGQRKFPAFEVKLHSGHIDGNIEYLTASLSRGRVPKINITMDSIYDPNLHYFSKQESLLLEINEINGIYERENFEYKLFKLQTVSIPPRGFMGGFTVPGGTILIPQVLNFTPPGELITEISDNVDALFSEEIDIKTNQVEYWFDITIDEKISTEIIFNTSLGESIYQRPNNSPTGTQC